MDELLGGMVKPGNPQFSQSESIGNLKDIGIDHNQSHRYQRRALKALRASVGDVEGHNLRA